MARRNYAFANQRRYLRLFKLTKNLAGFTAFLIGVRSWQSDAINPARSLINVYGALQKFVIDLLHFVWQLKIFHMPPFCKKTLAILQRKRTRTSQVIFVL